jgi:hypothetical protein
MANWNMVMEMPVQNPTTCTFGGVNLQTLYVTSAEIMMKSADRLAGTVFELGWMRRARPSIGSDLDEVHLRYQVQTGEALGGKRWTDCAERSL